LQKAFDVKDRASEREKFYISSHYYGTFRGQLDKQIETLEQWIQAYPHDAVPLDNLSLAEQDSGQLDKALAFASEAIKLSPKDHYAYQNLAASYQYLNRYDEAKAVADQAVAQKIDPWSVHMVLYWTAFIRGDEAAMQQELAQSTGKVQETITVLLHAQGECAQGKIKKARESLARSAAAAQAHGIKEWVALSLAGEAYCNAETGFVPEARQAMNAALAASETAESQADAARVFARTGDTARAEKLVADLAKEHPFDTLLNQVRLPTARAILDLQRNQPAQAIAALEPAKLYELGADRRSLSTYQAIYVRGEAYLHSHDGANAALEYQKILDHRGVQPTSLFLSLAKLGLGRAYGLQGNTAKAKTAYQDFFAIWKDADPDVPLLKAAKAEYEKLK
jgi:tetratricopeptide (TPR) repeat protein